MEHSKFMKLCDTISPKIVVNEYRMEHSKFMKLCDTISPKIVVNDKMSRVRTGKDAITVEIMLHCLLRWLSGGSYLDIRLSAGISPAKFILAYTSTWMQF